MGDYRFEPQPVYRGTTLNDLKEQLYSLNMRMLLAMQHHNEEAQEEIKAQIAAVQEAIDQMGPGRRRR